MFESERLETTMPAGPKRDFLVETINCFEAGANRATMVMCWILVMDHMFDHVFTHKLAEFNAALAKNPPKNITKITPRDDFTELKESKLTSHRFTGRSDSFLRAGSVRLRGTRLQARALQRPN
jgi:hypothetical protein